MMEEEKIEIPQIARSNGWQKLAKVKAQMCVSKENDGANGRYKYYTTANILDEAKRYLPETGGDIIMTDDIEEHAGKLFFTCIARFIDVDTGETVAEIKGMAELEKFAGQNAAQSSGTASTYARKRALAGLLLVETNEKDPDEIKAEPQKPQANTQARRPQRSAREELQARLAAEGIDREDFAKMAYNAPFSKIPEDIAERVLRTFQGSIEKYKSLKESAKEEIPL